MNDPLLKSIIVVGAGPVGLCCALAVAARGARVLVVDNGKRGAGWASGGMLAPTYETVARPDVPHALTDLAFESLSLWEKLATNLDLPLQRGTLFLARNAVEQSYLQDLAAQASLQEAATPIGFDARAAWRCDTDLTLAPRSTLDALVLACERVGIKFITHAVTEVQARSVTTRDGTRLVGNAVIIANGQEGNRLSGSLPQLAAITPVKGQMFAVALDSDVQIDQVVRAGGIYLIPRDGHLVIGATSVVNDDDSTTINTTDQERLYNEALALYPLLKLAPVVESWAGLRPSTPDNLPMLGWSNLEGVALASGTYRNGWLLAPAIGERIADLVMGQPGASIKLQPFSPERFPN
jgi:glycine oxidase